MVKLVIFDLDGVLTSTAIEHFQAWKSIIKREFNIDVKNEVEELTKGVSRMEALERILESIGKQYIALEDKERIARKKNEMYVTLISEFNEDYLFEGVLDLFDFLLDNGIKLALGSESQNAADLVECLGLLDMFEYIVDPTNKQSKPNPDIFLDARDYFGFTSEECIAVEDSQAGIDAINSAGMISIGIIEEGNLTECNYEFNTLKDIDYSIFKK